MPKKFSSIEEKRKYHREYSQQWYKDNKERQIEAVAKYKKDRQKTASWRFATALQRLFKKFDLESDGCFAMARSLLGDERVGEYTTCRNCGSVTLLPASNYCNDECKEEYHQKCRRESAFLHSRFGTSRSNTPKSIMVTAALIKAGAKATQSEEYRAKLHHIIKSINEGRTYEAYI